MVSTGAALVVGESLVDIVVRPDGSVVERPGGSAANAAVALARLGRPVRFATSYGADARGRTVADHLAADGVTLAGDPHVVPRTSVAHATIGSDGAATYSFDIAWRLGPLADEAPHVLHVCSFGPVVEPGAETTLSLVERLAPTTTVSYDLNLRPAITGAGDDVRDRVLRMLSMTDLLKASDEDLLALWPGRDPDETASALLDRGPVAVVLTRGGEGATWHVRTADGPASGAVPAEPVEVVDTIGAGDTFGAGLVDALWDDLGEEGRERLGQRGGGAWEAALGHAVRCAAVTVGRVGADPPRRSDLV